MPRAKKIDYAAMFSYDEKKGLYYATRTIDGIKKKFRAKDPEELYRRIEEAVNAEPVVPTFKEMADKWHDWKWPSIEENTQVSYEPYYKSAKEELGDKLITEIVPADVDRILNRMKDQGYASKTVKTQKNVIKQIFDYAIRQDKPFIIYNPASAVTVPRGLKRGKRTSPEDDVMQIIIDNVNTATFGLFPFFLLHTGCRPCEARAVTWGDIHLNYKDGKFVDGKIHIDKGCTYPKGMPVIKGTKTDAGNRDIDILPGLAKHLVRPEKAKDDDLLFPGENGKYLQENAYKRRWTHYCKDVGLIEDMPEEIIGKNGRRYLRHHYKPTLKAYDLRHGYATLLIESEVDMKSTQVVMGHADIETTMQVYADLRRRHRKNEFQKLANYMAENYGEADTKSGHQGVK